MKDSVQRPKQAKESVRKDRGPSRQAEIIARAMQGASDREIAAALSIEFHTVDSYWRRIRQRYGAANRTSCVVLALVAAYEGGALDKPADIECILSAAKEVATKASIAKKNKGPAD